MEKSFSERVEEARQNVQSLSPGEANQRRSHQPGILFIDPRDMDEINKTTGIIPGAISLPLSDLDGELPAELSSRSRPIITACQGGPMGALAAHALKQRGYDNVHFIDGGTQGWLDAGYPTVR
jgi:rhodanese-related sulfurtransferase